MDRILTFVGSVVDSIFKVVGSGDVTKQLKFEVDAQATAAVLTIDTGAQTVSRTMTHPVLAANGTYATLAAQTFTGAQTAANFLISGTSGAGFKLTSASGYGLVALNNDVTFSGTCGFMGGASGDNTLYLFAPTGFSIDGRVNNTNCFRIAGALATSFVPLLVSDTTEATSLTAAALVCSGGAAVAKQLRVGGIVTVSGAGNVYAESVTTGTTGFGAIFTTNDTGCQNQFLTFGSTRAGTTFGLSNNNLCAFYTAQTGATAPSGLAFGTNGNSPIVFGTNATARMTIAAAGSVFIGTDPGGSQILRVGGALRINSATLISTATAFTNGAAAALGTLSNAPVAGNPTKWIPIDDNGVTRYLPAW